MRTDCADCYGQGWTMGEPCHVCDGTGADVGDCPTCDGTGAVRHPRWGSPSCPDDHDTCPDCNGRGH